MFFDCVLLPFVKRVKYGRAFNMRIVMDQRICFVLIQKQLDFIYKLSFELFMALEWKNFIEKKGKKSVKINCCCLKPHVGFVLFDSFVKQLNYLLNVRIAYFSIIIFGRIQIKPIRIRLLALCRFLANYVFVVKVFVIILEFILNHLIKFYLLTQLNSTKKLRT